MFYFAYGSNMSEARLQQRIPSAVRIGVAGLAGYRFCFQVTSTKDGSGKCDALQTNDRNDLVLGVLFRIDPEAKPVLDGYEGVGVEYRAAQVEVELEDGWRERALIYLGTNLDSTVRPYPWYREHVLRGARENNLPTEYIDTILAVECMEDPDPQRAERELSIYS